MNFFASTDPHYHDTIRRSIQQYFNMSSLVQYEPAVDKIIALFIDTVIKRFADKPGSKCVLNLPRWIHYFSLDTVSNVTYSQPYGFIEADKDLHGMIKDIEESLNYQVYVSPSPIRLRLRSSPAYLAPSPIENILKKNPQANK